LQALIELQFVSENKENKREKEGYGGSGNGDERTKGDASGLEQREGESEDRTVGKKMGEIGEKMESDSQRDSTKSSRRSGSPTNKQSTSPRKSSPEKGKQTVADFLNMLRGREPKPKPVKIITFPDPDSIQVGVVTVAAKPKVKKEKVDKYNWCDVLLQISALRPDPLPPLAGEGMSPEEMTEANAGRTPALVRGLQLLRRDSMAKINEVMATLENQNEKISESKRMISREITVLNEVNGEIKIVVVTLIRDSAVSSCTQRLSKGFMISVLTE